MTQATLDEKKLDELLGRLLVDMGATIHAVTVLIGDRLGLYKALALGPATPAELAARTGTHERYVTEWLRAQAAAGYVMYEPGDHYSMSPEQAFALTNPDNPVFVPATAQLAAALFKGEPALVAAFRSGRGVAWGEHDHDLFQGVERTFRGGYLAQLVPVWIPALTGVEAKLRAGAKVADLGCGHGASTIAMARAFPASTFVGFDAHVPSIEHAQRAAAEAGVAERCTFTVSTAADYPGSGYDLVGVFDALHDMGDPGAAARHIRETLAADGTFMLVEPYAGDSVEDNLTPVGRLFYSGSTLVCVPHSLSEDGRAALGAQAGEKTIGEVVAAAGFSQFQRVAESPFNLVFEARP